LDVILGGGYNKYEGNHFGKVIWARFSQSELEIAIMMMRRLKLMAIFCKSQLSDSGEAKPVWRFAIEKCAL
jgi:hypothetical protein